MEEEAIKVSPERTVWPRPGGLKLRRAGDSSSQRALQSALESSFSRFQGRVLQSTHWAFVCTCVFVCATAFIRGCGGDLGQVGFECQQTACFSERVEFSLAPLLAPLSVFILKMCFQSTISWNLLAAARYEIPRCKPREKVSCQGEVYNRAGHSEECQLRSCHELETKPETRTLHGKSSPSSSDWKVESKNFSLNNQTELL